MSVVREKAERREGHGDDSKVSGIKKGTFLQVGTIVPLAHKPVSTDQKSGHEGGGEKHA